MEVAVEKVFSEQIKQQAIELFNLEQTELKKVGDFENYVFEGSQNGQPIIIRYTHSSHRSLKEVQAEMAFIHHLSEHGAQVSRPLMSINDRLVEQSPAEDGSFFLITLFEKAKGKLADIKDPLVWNEKLFSNWGEVTGQFHRLAKVYYPQAEEKRMMWYEDDLVENGENYIPSGSDQIKRVFHELISYINELPQTPDSFGLLHTDIHSGNFFIDGDQITVFDFDDSAYFYYISDVAIPLYYATWWTTRDLKDREARNKFALTFFRAFMEGYLKENMLDASWMKELPHFLKLRELILYLVFNKKFDLTNLSEREDQLIQSFKELLEKGQPVLDIDFEAVYQEILTKHTKA